MRLLLVLILALMGPGIHDERWLERASFTGFVYRANFALMRLLLHRQDYATEDRFLSRLTRWSGFIQFRPHPQLVQHQRGDLAEFWCRVMISIRYKSRPTLQGTGNGSSTFHYYFSASLKPKPVASVSSDASET